MIKLSISTSLLVMKALHNDQIVISTEGRNLITSYYKRKISRRFAPRNDVMLSCAKLSILLIQLRPLDYIKNRLLQK